MRRIAYTAARQVGQVSRRLGRGGGTSLPGLLLLRLRPRAAEELAGDLALGSAVVSATNGKTTTTRLLHECITATGTSVVTNAAGANLLRGVTTALLDGSGDLGLFEVDEAALPEVVDQLHPKVVVLENLFRDQLDRYGELETLAQRWRDMVSGLPEQTTLVVNADDPVVAALGQRHQPVLSFGVDDRSVGRERLPHAADSTRCPACDTPLEYDLVTIGHQGHWRCPACGLARPDPDVRVTAVRPDRLDGQHVTIETPDGSVDADLRLPGLHNAYNAAAAVAGALALRLPVDALGPALAATGAAFGRAERVEIGGRTLFMLLAKNPAGANENVRTVLLDEAPLHLLLLLNDRTADGQDVSWIWDVDYEPLLERAAALTVGGDRAYDLALRFRYAGAAESRVAVHADPATALDAALASSPEGGTIYALPTYTAMLDLRAVLVDRGVTHAFWEEART